MTGDLAERKGRPRPQRSCIACRRPRPKRELIRIVRTPGGAVELDRTGKLSGRGVYLCWEPDCWEAGLKGNTLEHNLRLTERLAPELRQRLLQKGLALAVAAGTEAAR